MTGHHGASRTTWHSLAHRSLNTLASSGFTSQPSPVPVTSLDCEKSGSCLLSPSRNLSSTGSLGVNLSSCKGLSFGGPFTDHTVAPHPQASFSLPSIIHTRPDPACSGRLPGRGRCVTHPLVLCDVAQLLNKLHEGHRGRHGPRHRAGGGETTKAGEGQDCSHPERHEAQSQRENQGAEEL